MSTWDELVVLAAAAIGAGGATLAASVTSRRDARERRREAVAARRATEYRHVLRMAYNVDVWAHEQHPLFSYSGDDERDAPELPPASDQIDARIAARFYGSPRVIQLHAEFDDAVKAFISDAGNITMLQDDRRQAPSSFGADSLKELRALQRGLPDRRKAIGDAIEAMQDRMAADIDDERAAALTEPTIRWWRRAISRDRAPTKVLTPPP